VPTFVSMVKWTGEPQPHPADVRDAIAARGQTLAAAGLHSVVFLPDEGACSAIMIATCDLGPDVARLAEAILRGATAHVDSMKFEDVPPAPVELELEDAPPPPPGYLDAVLQAVEAG
jgi:hypothetical protein